MNRFLLLICLVLVMVDARAEQDEMVLGKAAGYPFQRLSATFSLFNEQYKVGTFSAMDQIFWSSAVAAGTTSSELSLQPNSTEISYLHEGKSLRVDDFLDRQRITGLLILKGNQVVFERYQYGRKREDKFASMSMAKTVVAMLIGVALKDGAIRSLDDLAERYAPELGKTAYGAITIRNLLQMTSGVKWSDLVEQGRGGDIAQLSADTYFQRAQGGASALYRVQDRAYAQGVRFNYSSADTFALGIVLRGAIKRDIASYLSDRIWKPIGAEASASWLKDWSDVEAAYCCLNARLRDYGRLGLLLARDGMWEGREIVPAEFMLAATNGDQQPEHLRPRKATSYFGYGYQTWLHPYKTRTFEARGLYGQQIVVQPASQIVIVLTSANKTPNTPVDVFVERNRFFEGVFRALGGKVDIYK